MKYFFLNMYNDNITYNYIFYHLFQLKKKDTFASINISLFVGYINFAALVSITVTLLFVLALVFFMVYRALFWVSIEGYVYLYLIAPEIKRCF